MEATGLPGKDGMGKGMVVSAKSTGRFGFKCGCCLMHKSKARCKKGRDAERRMLKRRERAAWKAEVAADA